MDKEIISDRLADIGVNTIEQVLKLADETGEDRNTLARIFVQVMHDKVCSGTFSRYEFK